MIAELPGGECPHSFLDITHVGDKRLDVQAAHAFVSAVAHTPANQHGTVLNGFRHAGMFLVRSFVLPVLLAVGVLPVFFCMLELIMSQLGAQLPTHFLAIFQRYDQLIRRAPKMLAYALAVIGN